MKCTSNRISSIIFLFSLLVKADNDVHGIINHSLGYRKSSGPPQFTDFQWAVIDHDVKGHYGVRSYDAHAYGKLIVIRYAYWLYTSIHRESKNNPAIISRSLVKHCSILGIFGRNIPEKIRLEVVFI